MPSPDTGLLKEFHLINKGNGVEANYDLGGEPSAQLVAEVDDLVLQHGAEQHMPERRFLDMGDAVRELTHALCQRGPAMRKLRGEHRSWMQVRSDAKRMMMVQSVMPREETPTDNYALLKNQQRQLPWRFHQSEAVAKYGRCCWDDCPGKQLSTAKRPRSSDTHMCCEECSAYLGKNMFLCIGFVKDTPVNCHRHYRMNHHNKEFTSSMVIN